MEHIYDTRPALCTAGWRSRTSRSFRSKEMCLYEALNDNNNKKTAPLIHKSFIYTRIIYRLSLLLKWFGSTSINNSKNKKKPEHKSMKALCLCRYIFFRVKKKTHTKKRGKAKACRLRRLIGSAAETKEVVCVLSRHRDSLRRRQEKPLLRPQVGMEKLCVCVCVCVCVSKGNNLLNSSPRRKKNGAFLNKFTLHT